MYIYIYIYIYTCMHACMHAYIHTLIRAGPSGVYGRSQWLDSNAQSSPCLPLTCVVYCPPNPP